jgi:hypothetical protein
VQRTPLAFVENVGQFDADARYQVHRGNSTIYFTDDALWFTVLEQWGTDTKAQRGVNLQLSFLGANSHARLESFDRLDTHISYFIGSDSAAWRTDVPAWSGLRYVDLYPGVDLEITGEEGRWDWRLVIRNSQFEISDVRLRVDGADGLVLDRDRLRLTTAVGDLALPLRAVEGAASDSPPRLSTQNLEFSR